MPDHELLARSRWMLLVIAIVVVGLARAGDDMTAAHQELLLGCLDRGELRSVCECAGDEVLRRIDHSPERCAAGPPIRPTASPRSSATGPAARTPARARRR